MRSNVFLLLFAFTISAQIMRTCSFTTYLSPSLFDLTQLFSTKENTIHAAIPSTITEYGFDLEKVMTSSFTTARRLSQLTITADLSKYTNRKALQRALTSCIQAQTACGYVEKHPILGEWEIMSPRCNPESATEEEFTKWLADLSSAEKKAVHKLEAFINTVIAAEFKQGTYNLSTRSASAPKGK